MLYFGSPAFFVDASDGLMLERGPRILESAIGPFAEMILAGCGVDPPPGFPDARFAAPAVQVRALNYFVIFENLIPLLELDGYFILAEAIQVPDLRRALAPVHPARPVAQVRGRETAIAKQEIGLGAYAFVGVAFTIFSVWVASSSGRRSSGGWCRPVERRARVTAASRCCWRCSSPARLIRGLITLVRTPGKRRPRARRERIRFRFETSWRVEAAEMIDALPAFDDLPEDVLSRPRGPGPTGRTSRPGQPVFRQGDRADAFYVVRKRIVAASRRSIRTRATRRCSGRWTEATRSASWRCSKSSPTAATVRARARTELFAVDKATFDRLLATRSTRRRSRLTLQTLAELREMPAFSTLGTEELSELLDARSLGDGQPRRRASRAGRGRGRVLRDPLGPGRRRSRRDGHPNAGARDALRRDRVAARRPADRERRGEDAGPGVPPGSGGVRPGRARSVPPGKL